MSTRDLRVDAAILRYMETVAALRAPALIVFAGLYGFQLFIVLTGRSETFWLAPAAVIAVAAWVLIGLGLARRRWPQMLHLLTLLRAFQTPDRGVPSAEPATPAVPPGIKTGLRAWHLWALVGVLAVPGGVGLLAATLVAFVVLLVPVRERPPYREAMLSLVLIALLMFVGSLLGHHGFALIPGISGGVVLAGSAALALAVMVAAQGVATERNRLFWPERWTMGWALVAAPLIFLPYSWLPVASFVLIAVIAPLATLAILLLRLFTSRADTRRSLNRQSLREHLAATVGGPADVEDVVRESDGFYRLCAPQYAVINPARAQPGAGPNGVLAWIGGPDDAALPQALGECIAFRNMGTDEAGLYVYRDAVGQAARRALVDAMPDFALPSLEDLRHELGTPWDVRHLSPISARPLAKLPWEHDELLVLPVQWSGRFIFPPGTGLHDAQGIPCHIDGVEVRIDLAADLVEAARHPASAPAAARQGLFQLQANYRRILPAVYETLYTLLIGEVRKYHLPILFEQGNQQDLLGSQTLRTLREAVNSAVGQRLPEPVGRLVCVSVANITQPDTTILADSQREAIKNHRATERTLAIRQFKRLDELEEWLKGKLADISEAAHFHTLQKLRPEVFRAIDDCQQELNTMVSDAGDKLDPNVAFGATKAIREGHADLRQAAEAELEKMTKALNVIRAAFNDEPISAYGGTEQARTPASDGSRSAREGA